MCKDAPVLYIFSGLPAVGKSTLATALAKHTGATYLRVDVIEQGLKDIYQSDIYDEGYQLMFRIAQDNLKNGLSVIGDSCNSVAESRMAWQQVAENVGVEYVNIEVFCSDNAEHQYRVEHRQSSIPNLRLPSWKQVQERAYLPWDKDIISIDTAGKDTQQSIGQLFELLESHFF